MAEASANNSKCSRWSVISDIIKILVSLATPVAILLAFRDPARLPQLSISATLEQVGENDSCYIVKTKIDVENKSKSKVNVLGSFVQLFGVKAGSTSSPDTTYLSNVSTMLEQPDYQPQLNQYLTYKSAEQIGFFIPLARGAWFNPQEVYHTERITAVPKGTHLLRLDASFNVSLEVKNVADSFYVKDGVINCVTVRMPDGTTGEKRILDPAYKADRKFLLDHNVVWTSTYAELWLK